MSDRGSSKRNLSFRKCGAVDPSKRHLSGQAKVSELAGGEINGTEGNSPESEVKMKSLTVWRIMLVLVLALTFAVGETYAQRRQGQGKGMPRYDGSTEVTLTGTVEKIESHIGKMGWNGTHVRVRFEAETLIVHVGPTPYLTQEGFAFAEGDQIEVIGSKIKFEGNDILVAREIKKGDKVLTLRNRQGIPVWSRSRWRY